jgi:hypothetical protein
VNDASAVGKLKLGPTRIVIFAQQHGLADGFADRCLVFDGQTGKKAGRQVDQNHGASGFWLCGHLCEGDFTQLILQQPNPGQTSNVESLFFEPKVMAKNLVNRDFFVIHGWRSELEVPIPNSVQFGSGLADQP